MQSRRKNAGKNGGGRSPIKGEISPLDPDIVVARYECSYSACWRYSFNGVVHVGIGCAIKVPAAPLYNIQLSPTFFLSPSRSPAYLPPFYFPSAAFEMHITTRETLAQAHQDTRCPGGVLRGATR